MGSWAEQEKGEMSVGIREDGAAPRPSHASVSLSETGPGPLAEQLRKVIIFSLGKHSGTICNCFLEPAHGHKLPKAGEGGRTWRFGRAAVVRSGRALS